MYRLKNPLINDAIKYTCILLRHSCANRKRDALSLDSHIHGNDISRPYNTSAEGMKFTIFAH